MFLLLSLNQLCADNVLRFLFCLEITTISNYFRRVLSFQTLVQLFRIEVPNGKPYLAIAQTCLSIKYGISE